MTILIENTTIESSEHVNIKLVHYRKDIPILMEKILREKVECSIDGDGKIDLIRLTGEQIGRLHEHMERHDKGLRQVISLASIDKLRGVEGVDYEI